MFALSIHGVVADNIIDDALKWSSAQTLDKKMDRIDTALTVQELVDSMVLLELPPQARSSIDCVKKVQDLIGSWLPK